jgi:hypothetical protein
MFSKREFALPCCGIGFPDLLDKPASMFLGVPRRGVEHSLLIFLALTLLTWIFSSKQYMELEAQNDKHKTKSH